MNKGERQHEQQRDDKTVAEGCQHAGRWNRGRGRQEGRRDVSRKNDEKAGSGWNGFYSGKLFSRVARHAANHLGLRRDFPPEIAPGLLLTQRQ